MDEQIKLSKEAGVVKLSYGLDGIMYAYISEDVDNQVEIQKLASETIGEMTNKEKIPLLVEYAHFVLPNKEAQDYWAQKESSPYTSAEAYIVNGLALRLILNFFLKVKKPPRPTKIFDKRGDAVTWLKTYL